MNDSLSWLFKWYYLHCKDDWNKTNAINIGTDKKGWYLSINLNKTELQDQNFQTLQINRTDEDWLECSVEEKTFKGFCGPSNLMETIKIFRNWACQS